MPPEPRILLLDWDNTLVDSWPQIHRAINAARAAVDEAPWPFARTRAWLTAPAPASLQTLFGPACAPVAEAAFLDAFAAAADALVPAEGAAALLATCRELGITVAVVSNKPSSVLRAEADRLGWTGTFERLVGSGDAPQDKPHRAAAEAGAGEVPGRHVWLAGDAAADIHCARAAGCAAVHLAPPDGPPLPNDTPRPDLKVDSCHTLAQRLRTMP